MEEALLLYQCLCMLWAYGLIHNFQMFIMEKGRDYKIFFILAFGVCLIYSAIVFLKTSIDFCLKKKTETECSQMWLKLESKWISGCCKNLCSSVGPEWWFWSSHLAMLSLGCQAGPCCPDAEILMRSCQLTPSHQQAPQFLYISS